MSENRYPKQAYAIKRQTKVMSVEAHLFSPTKESAPPLELHSGFSRFLVTIIDKSTSTTYTPRANIPALDIPAILEKTKFAMQDYFLGPVPSDSNNDFHSSAAFTQKLLAGVHKGKTPAEVLLANPEERDNLLKTKQWLEANLSKFAGNKAQIDAIQEAVTLLDIGELSEGTPVPSNTSSKIIYKRDYKHFSERDERGNYLIYSISITYDRSKNYPFTCEISNCFAPIEIGPTGTHHPNMKMASHPSKSSLAMSDEEWFSLITHLSNIKNHFEEMKFSDLFTKAEALDEENRSNSSKNNT